MPPKKHTITASAERHRKYLERIKSDPEKHKIYLEKQRKKYRERLGKGDLRPISQRTDREKRQQRKRWKLNSKASRDARKKATRDCLMNLTPPQSPAEADVILQITGSGQRKRGRPKHRDASRAKAYRKIAKLENEIEQKNRTIERLRKRYQRQLHKTLKNSPRNMTKKLLQGACKSVKKNMAVRKTLIFHHALVSDLSRTQAKWRKKLLQNVRLDIVRKYRFRKMISVTTGIGRKALDSKFRGKDNLRQKSKLMRSSVQTFLERDDNSRISACKKDKAGSKQIRFLNHSLKMLHHKYLSENQVKVSFAYFCRNRPVHVKKPSLKDREVCVCKKCENFRLMLSRLVQEKLADSKDTDEFLASMVCDTNSLDCMHGNCKKCKSKQRIKTLDFDKEKQVTWWEWTTINHAYTSRDGNSNATKRSVKMRKTTSLGHLVVTINKSIPGMLKHLYTIYHQYSVISSLKANLENDTALIHFDFSENWNCKYARETMSVHFGASQQQVSLHTGLIYTSKGTQGFCSISPSNIHESFGVWAHLKSTLQYLRSINPEVVHLHLLSDSPSSQYRNKSSFYLMCNVPRNLGFKTVVWNFLESGHGKGAADGIGATVKREADRFVANGNDIPDAETMFAMLSQTSENVKFLFVSRLDIDEMERQLSDNLKAFPGTMSLHQVWPDLSAQIGTIKGRNFSCYCKLKDDSNSICSCYHPKMWFLPDDALISKRSVVNKRDANRLTNPPASLAKSCNGDFPIVAGNVSASSKSDTTPANEGYTKPIGEEDTTRGLEGDVCSVKKSRAEGGVESANNRNDTNFSFQVGRSSTLANNITHTHVSEGRLEIENTNFPAHLSEKCYEGNPLVLEGDIGCSNENAIPIIRDTSIQSETDRRHLW